jgi:hypothetical protein
LGINRTVSTPAPAATDPYYAYRSLILNFDGNFNDSSPNALTVTPYGNAQIVSDGTFGSVASFDGSGDTLTAPANAVFAFGTGDFTIEGWFYSLTSATSVRGMVDFRTATTGTNGLMLRENNGGFLVFLNNTTILSTTSGRLANQWQHVALVRKSGVITLYIDGVSSATVSNSTNLSDNNLRLSGFIDTQASPYAYNGLIGPTRISPWAEYTSNFTPSQDLFPAAQQLPVQDPWYDKTSLILNMDGTPGSTTFVDDSPNALAVTAAGDAQIVSDATFGTVASFDGAGDILTIPNSLATDLPGDFTIECWFYGNGISSTTGTLIGKWKTASQVAWAVLISSSVVQLGIGNSGGFVAAPTFATNISNNQWYHVAITRSGTSIKCFLNGVQIGSTLTYASNMSSTSTTDLGYLGSSNSNYFNGKIGPTRITKGIARYTANFTPPTGQFPTS